VFGWASPASGLVIGYTGVNTTHDGPGHCLSNWGPHCNTYDGKQYVWINGGPSGNPIGPNGNYFFTVLAPSMALNPNDAVPRVSTDKNLSDEYGPYTSRTFSVLNGRISSYSGAWEFDSLQKMIHLLPYGNTNNSPGVYLVAICSLEHGYPVALRDCRWDAFKVPEPDECPPACPRAVMSANVDGERTVYQHFHDAGGIDSLEVTNITNATWSLDNFFQGTAGEVNLTATKINENQQARIEIVVDDVNGNEATCDPVLSTLKSRHGKAGPAVERFNRLHQSESVVTIGNRSPGFSKVVITVNGRSFRPLHMRPKQQRRVQVRRAMRPGARNTIIVRGYGSARASADIAVSN
jgi:hypothetical protein